MIQLLWNSQRRTLPGKYFHSHEDITVPDRFIYIDQRHRPGTGIKREKGKKFDTPTLAEVWRTGPYLNDGRAVTIQEIFKKYNTGDMHGTTTGMTEKEPDDLAEYVLSL